MEAALNPFTAEDSIPFEEAHQLFFDNHSPAFAREAIWHLFMGWVNLPADKRQHSEEEMALFLDQLIDLVAAASTLHEANRATVTRQKGTAHE